MRILRKIIGNQYWVSALTLMLAFLFLNVKLPEYQRQFLGPSEILTINKQELVTEDVTGMTWKEDGYWLINENEAVIRLRRSFFKKSGQIEIYVNEMSEKNINGYVRYSDDEIKKFSITKGNNVIQLKDTPKRNSLEFVFLDSEGAKLRLEYFSFIARGSEKLKFPWDLCLFCIFVVFLLLYCSNKNYKIQEWAIRIVFVTSFLLVYLQLENVYFYFDDFGYRSLTYRGLVDSGDIQDGFFKIIEFLKNHYLYWGGRILYFFIGILLMQDLFWMRLIQAMIITGIFYLCYRIVIWSNKKKSILLAAILPIVSYMLLEKNIMADTAYWFTASVLYVFPIFFVLLGVILYHDVCFGDNPILVTSLTKKKKCVILVILFVASFSQEQISSAMVAMIFALTVEFIWKHRRIYKMQILSNIVVWIGFLLLLLCPGNAVRMETSQGRSLIQNVGTVLSILGADNQKNITMIFFACAVCCNFYLGKKATSKWFRLLNYGIATGIIGLLIIMVWYQVGCVSAIQVVLSYIYPNYKKVYAYVLESAVLLIILFQVLLWYLRYRKNSFICYLIGGALGALVVACVSPDVAIRTVFPYYLLIISFISDVVSWTGEKIRNRKVWIRNVGIVIGVFFISVSVLNYQYILIGYHTNSYVEEENMKRLSNYWEYVDEKGVIDLYKHSDDSFSNVMPYMDGYSWVEGYIRNNYHIPSEYVINWESYNDFLELR